MVKLIWLAFAQYPPGARLLSGVESLSLTGPSDLVAQKVLRSFSQTNSFNWPAPGSEDTELGVLMEPEVGHGETKVYPRVQA